MVKSLVIHIGDQKAGSTSIQATLVSSGITSPEQSIFYPARHNHRALVATLTDTDQFDARQERFTSLASRLDASDDDIGVISAERFEISDPKRLHDALERYMPNYLDTVRLIAYVRPHKARLVSSWAQQSKVRVTGDLETFYARFQKNGRLDYHKRLSAWKDVFGDALTVRPMIKAKLHNGSVVSDFARFCLASETFHLVEETKNTSLNLEEIALLNRFHAASPEQAKKKNWRRRLGTMLAERLAAQSATGTETKPQIHRALHARVLQDCMHDAQALDAAFFEGTPMMDALKTAQTLPAPQTIDAAELFPEWELRFYDAFFQLAADMAELAPQKMSQHIGALNITHKHSRP